MTFNQIKTSETLLQDKTKSAWVVGYIPKDSFKEATTVNTDVIAEGIQDITVNNISELPFAKYIDNYNYKGEVYDVSLRTKTKSFTTTYVDTVSVVNYYKQNYIYDFDTLETRTNSDRINETEYNTLDTPKFNFTPANNNAVADLMYSDMYNYKDGILSQLNSIAGSNTDISQSELLSYNGKIVYDTSSKKYYICSVNSKNVQQHEGLDSIGYLIDTNSKLATEYLTPMVTSKDYSKVQQGLKLEGNLGKDSYYALYFQKCYSISLNQLAVTSSVTIDNDRYHLEDQPFDMFCIPYSDTLPIYKNGTKLFNANKSLAVSIATAIGAKSGSGNVYDVQLLPYCPISAIQQDGAIDIGNYKVDYIKQNNVDVGVVLWATSSSFTVNIDKNIEVTDYKLTNECDMYRLVSPNYNGQFEFNPAKNNGVTGFTASCTYKPFSPYIKVAPIFNRLYGQDFKDARGLICQGDFSLPQVSNAWANYQLNNKNYEAIFNREITNMEINNKYQNIQKLVGGVAGAGTGTIAGAALGGIGGAIAGGALSLLGAGADYAIQKTLQNEALDYK